MPSVQAGGGATHDAPSGTNPWLQSNPQSSPRHAAWPFATWGHAVHVGSPQPFAGDGSTHSPPHSFCEEAHGGVAGRVQPGPFPSTQLVPPQAAPSHEVPPLFGVVPPLPPPLLVVVLPKRRSCAPPSTDPHPALASKLTSMQANLRMHLRR